MKHILIVIYVVACLSLFVCCANKESGANICEINLEQHAKKFQQLSLNDLNCEVNYITLKNDGVILNSIDKIEFSENFVLVSDFRQCVLFDLQGNVVAKIGNVGYGPNEYLYVSNICFGNNKKIYLQSRGVIFVYDFNGNFIRKFKPEVNIGNRKIKSWAVFNDSLFIGQVPNYSGREEYKAVFFNGKGETVKTADNYIFINRKTEITNSSFDSHASIYRFENKTFFKEEMNDTLFLVNDEFVLTPAFYINLGSYKQPNAERELNIIEMTKTISKYIFVDNVYESSQYLFLDCNFSDHSPAKRLKPKKINGSLSMYYTTSVLGVYNKLSKELLLTQPTKEDNKLVNKGLFNDYDGGARFYPQKMVNDSTLAMCMEPYLLKAHVASDAFKNSKPQYPEKKKALEKLANSLSENDNPVLMLVRLKE